MNNTVQLFISNLRQVKANESKLERALEASIDQNTFRISFFPTSLSTNNSDNTASPIILKNVIKSKFIRNKKNSNFSPLPF